MKKILALLLAGILCATAAYTALAVDEEEETTTSTPIFTEDDAAAAADAVNNLVNALKDDGEAQEIADNIVDAVKKGAATEDVNALLLALADYINSKGYDVAEIKSGEKTKEFVGDFLEDCGIDSEALGKALDNANEVYDNMFGGSTGKNTDAGTSIDIGGSPDYYGVDSTTIPDTGYMN